VFHSLQQTTESLRLVGTSGDPPAHPAQSRLSCSRLPRATSSQVLVIPQDGDHTTSWQSVPVFDHLHISKSFFLPSPGSFSIHMLLPQIPEPAHALSEKPHVSLVCGVGISIRAMLLTSPYTLHSIAALT